MGKQVIYSRDLRNHLIIDEDGMIGVKVKDPVLKADIEAAIRQVLSEKNNGSLNVNVLNPLSIADIQEAIQIGVQELNIEGIEVNVDKLVVKHAFRSTSDSRYALDKEYHALTVCNDSLIEGKEIIVSVNGINIPLLPGDVLDDEFEPFEEVVIQNPNEIPFRVLIKEKAAGENV